MRQRYIETEIYLNGERGVMLEDLGIEPEAGEVGQPSACVIDLWRVEFFYASIAGGGTVVQCSGGDAFHVSAEYPDFLKAFIDAANLRAAMPGPEVWC